MTAFDEFENEVNKTTRTIAFRDTSFTIPYDLPFFTKARILRLAESEDKAAEVQLNEMYAVLRTLLGESQLWKLEGLAPSDEEVAELLRNAMGLYSAKGNGESEPKNEIKNQRGKTRK